MTRERVLVAAAMILSLVFVSCTRSEATVKYLPKDKNVVNGQVLQWSFDKDKTGAPPAGAHPFGGRWEVRKEGDAPSAPNVLCQTATAQFPALSLSDKIFADVTVSVHFKPVSGNGDRAAGIIFRVQDRDNFYIVRANALEDNVNIYKYVAGRRHAVQEGSMKVASGKWQELRVEVTGNRIRGYLNGTLAVEAEDDTFKAGKVGLWTKADSVTCFDNVKATAH